jgi:hypothetical protein
MQVPIDEAAAPPLAFVIPDKPCSGAIRDPTARASANLSGAPVPCWGGAKID